MDHCAHSQTIGQTQTAKRPAGSRYAFRKVTDARGHDIRGLWKRNGRFYARLLVEDARTGREVCRRVLLREASSVAEAKSKLEELKQERRTGSHRSFTIAPYLHDFEKTYFQLAAGKRHGTTYRERSSLKIWKKFLGEVRLSKITKKQIYAFISARLGEGVSSRTVNLDLNTLHLVFKKARDLDLVHSIPTNGIKRLKYVPKRRPLLTLAQVKALCEAGAGYKNGGQFCDYVYFLAFSGARVSEALRLRWSDVNLDKGTLTIGSDGQTKNYESRIVNISSELHRHLVAMQQRRAPDSEWLFPSPRRGDTDRHAKTFAATFQMARAKLDLATRLHDLRHYFISQCVMAGVDFMTIARWAGHRDGGILIGKVYGHLSDEHARKQAVRVSFA